MSAMMARYRRLKAIRDAADATFSRERDECALRRLTAAAVITSNTRFAAAVRPHYADITATD